MGRYFIVCYMTHEIPSRTHHMSEECETRESQRRTKQDIGKVHYADDATYRSRQEDIVS